MSSRGNGGVVGVVLAGGEGKRLACVRSKLRSLLTLLFISTVIFGLTNIQKVYGDETEAISVISLAEDSLEAAFLSVLEIERSGGEISELVLLLNTALDYQSDAERFLEVGEYEKADFMARKVVEASNVIIEVDVGMQVVAEHVSEVGFMNQLYISLGVVCSTVLFGFLGWRQFKIYYIRNMTVSRPEVVLDGS
jgi:hypothetical protein